MTMASCSARDGAQRAVDEFVAKAARTKHHYKRVYRTWARANSVCCVSREHVEPVKPRQLNEVTFSSISLALEMIIV